MCKQLIRLFLICIVFFKNNGALVQDFYWRDYLPGDIPYDVYPLGDGKYIGQVFYNVSLPATIYPHSYVAVAELYGKREIKEDIKILCSRFTDRFYWQDVDFTKSKNDQMKNVVKGGFQLGYNLLIGRTYHDGEWKIGKVIPIEIAAKGLRVWDQNGGPLKIMSFQILKYNISQNFNFGSAVQCT